MSIDLTHASLLVGSGLFCAVGSRCARAIDSWLKSRAAERQQFQQSLAKFNNQEHELRRPTLSEPKLSQAWHGYRRFVVERIETTSNEIKSFYFMPEDRRPLPPYLPGQYVTLRLISPNGVTPLVRCYSLSERAEPNHYRITVKLAGVMSTLLHSQLEQGQVVELQAPRGDFYLDPSEKRPLAFIAAGIGITPIYSMLTTALAANPQHEITLFYGVRNRADHAFQEALRNLAKRHKSFHYIPCYSQPTNADRFGVDYLLPQRVDLHLVQKMLGEPKYPIYLCGPGTFMESLVPGLLAWGCTEQDLHYEAFGPSTVKRTTETLVEAPSNIRVTFDQTQQTCAWSSQANSVLEFAERHGVNLPSGCRSGNCGMCAVKIKAGAVRYASRPAAEIPAGHCLACVAIPSEDLTLDA